MDAAVELCCDGPVASVNLTSNDGENRIGAETVATLRAACVALREDNTVRVAVVSGEGGCFSLGWSTEVLAVPNQTLPGDPFGCLAELPFPVIAAIGGDAISAGLELALACDLRVASADARFAFPETADGLIPLAGGTQRLPRLVGRGRALAMVLLGRQIDATAAHAWGLVNVVAPHERLRETVGALVETIVQRGPIAERFAKEAVSQGVELPLARALRYELDLTVLLQTTEDRAEGVRAFAEKRPPRFQGR
jgi:enoyl-CoA hydratase/carnithine racemase